MSTHQRIGVTDGPQMPHKVRQRAVPTDDGVGHGGATAGYLPQLLAEDFSQIVRRSLAESLLVAP